LAAALALAEETGAGGSDLLAAYVAGLEVACRLGDAIDPSHYLAGFHPTGTMGTFGAAAACAHLLRLGPVRTSHALGIAGTLAAGVRAHRGTMAKALNAGRAAQNGVLAARLAAGGFTASSNIFDDPMGYFSAACRGRIERSLLIPGEPFFLETPGVSIKFYPCAGVMHSVLDALIELVRAHDLKPAQIVEVRVKLGRDAGLPLVYDRPQSGLEAKFSLPFSAAAAIVHRAAGLQQYTDEQVHDPLLYSVMKRVKLERTRALRSVGNAGVPARIEVVTVAGRYRRATRYARGHPNRRLSRTELTEKFNECAADKITLRNARAFASELWRIERVSSIRRMVALLRPRSGPAR
jgi:2-methylcitrate dehydratase PrpD